MIGGGGEPCSCARAALAAARAARAQARSVSISVRVCAGALARAIATRAPARSSESRSSSSARRKPAVEPSETISTSSWRPARPTGLISGDGAADVLRACGLEAGRAHEGHGPHGRGTADVEAGSVALLDRPYGSILAPPGERPYDREAGGDARYLWREEGKAA